VAEAIALTDGKGIGREHDTRRLLQRDPIALDRLDSSASDQRDGDSEQRT
jgi:hypothetical protein